MRTLSTLVLFCFVLTALSGCTKNKYLQTIENQTKQVCACTTTACAEKVGQHYFKNDNEMRINTKWSSSAGKRLAKALPIAWKGTLSQYAGRIHRAVEGKQEVTVYDYLDTGLPMLERMFRKREKGYKAMGYQLASFGQTRLL